jgi:cytochrome d ubiquinol oxidase subunit I
VVVPNPTGVDGVFMYTAQAVSPGVSAGQVLTSLIALTAVYGVLAVVEVFLLVRYARAGVAGVMPSPSDGDDKKKSDDDVLAFAY